MIGFASLEDAQRIVDAVHFVEQYRPPTRRQSRRQPNSWTLEVVLGKTDAALNKSTVSSPVSGTVSVWTGSDISGLTDSGDNITAYSMFGNVGSGKFVVCIGLAMGYLVIAAEC